MSSQESYIISAFKKLNAALKKLSNEIIVLDFSHFSPIGKNDKYDIYFKFIAGKEEYKEAYSKYIKAAIDDANSVWRKYKKGNQRLLYNFVNNNNTAKGKKNITIPEPTEKKYEKIESDFNARKHLIKGFSKATKLPGQCFIIYAESHDDAQSIVYVLLKNKIETDKYINLKKKLPKDFDTFGKELHSLLVHEMVNGLVKEKADLYDQTKKAAVRAAISQVAARNTSHNIGSHVMNKLTGDLDKLLFSELKNYSSSVDLYNGETDNNKILLDQISIFNNYIKCRMDYLADITFGTPVMHTNKKVYTELYKDFDKVRLLLDNISGLSKNFPFEIKFTLNGKEITAKHDFSIALPNDLLGCQAFYNIIENVIRNTAKHNQKKSGTTKFTINFKEIADKSASKIIDKELWYEVEIYDDVKINGIKKLVRSQNEKLNLSVLDEKHNNQLRNSSLGLLEMEASAAYLRKLDITNIEDDAYEVEYDNKISNKHGNLNILKAFNKNGALGYRFFVSKPTEYLLVGEFSEIEAERRTELLKMGIWFRTEDEFKKEVEKEPGTVFNHQFVFHKSVQFINDLGKEENRKYKTQLPVRIVELNENTECLLILLNTKDVDFEKIEECVWQIWFNKIKGNYEVVNVFTSYQASNDKHNATNRYNIALLNHNDYWCQSKEDKACKNVDYLEPLSSNAQKMLPLFNNTLAEYVHHTKWKEIKGHKIFEAAISKILVIDERVQRFANTDYEADNVKAPIKDIFSYINVLVPDDKEYPLDADNFKKDLTNKICTYIDSEIANNDFMLIHFSILERMYKDDMKMVEVKLKDWAEKVKKRVVVTSGRGKPREHLPKEVCYVNLSPVLNVFTQTRSKYAMNYLLNQARK